VGQIVGQIVENRNVWKRFEKTIGLFLDEESEEEEAQFITKKISLKIAVKNVIKKEFSLRLSYRY